MEELVITSTGFARLNTELERLKTENPEYLDAREEKIQLEQRIGLIQRRLGSARIVEPCLGNGRVDVGERVRVREIASGQSLELELVGQLEGNLAAGRVSVASPLGQALVGLREGEIAAVDAPRGRVGFEVLAVELPAGAAA